MQDGRMTTTELYTYTCTLTFKHHTHTEKKNKKKSSFANITLQKAEHVKQFIENVP